MPRAGLLSVGTARPQLVLSNDELAELQGLDTTDEWIVRRTGIKQRHRLSGDETLTSLAAQAARQALEKAGRDVTEATHILACTVSADYLMPGLATTVAGELGATTAATADINAACSGFIHGLDMAISIVESGRSDMVLLIGADAMSRVTDPQDRGTAVVFGDGAGALVIAAGDYEHGAAPFVFGTDADQRELLYALRDERKLLMRGREVYRHAVANMVDSSRKAIAAAGITADDVDLFIAHQANARIIETTGKELGIPEEKMFYDVERSANTSAASVPLAIGRAEEEGVLKPGMTVGVTGFGSGFVWGAGIIRWRETPRS